MTHAEELLSEKGKLRLDLAILTGEHEALLARIEALTIEIEKQVGPTKAWYFSRMEIAHRLRELVKP